MYIHWTRIRINLPNNKVTEKLVYTIMAVRPSQRSPDQRFRRGFKSRSGPWLFFPSPYIWCQDQPLELTGILLPGERAWGDLKGGTRSWSFKGGGINVKVRLVRIPVPQADTSVGTWLEIQGARLRIPVLYYICIDLSHILLQYHKKLNFLHCNFISRLGYFISNGLAIMG